MKNQYIDLFNETKSLLAQHSASIFNGARDEAAAEFAAVDFPTRKTEEYLYCPLFDAIAIDWGVNLNRISFGLKPEEMFRCAVPGIKAVSAYVVNDVWCNAAEIDLGSGAFVCSMAHAAVAHADILNTYYNKVLKEKNDAFVLLNQMLVQDGMLVYVPRGVEIEMPLQVVYMMRAGQPLLANSRNLIVVEDNASLYCVDCDHAMDNSPYLALRINEIYVGEGAKFHYCAMESSSSMMNNLRKYAVSQQRDSVANLSFYGLNNGNTRNDVVVDLNGEGAETWLGGMLLSDKEQRCENYTIIRHHVPNCKSEELFKYILDDNAQAGFSGRIVVDEGAQKSVSYQTNRNICLSDGARALGRPQLEIYADDVKCGHGATTGMLDKAAIFYMQQRGIGFKEARMLLLQAFAADVLAKIYIEPLRDRLHLMVEKRLKGEPMNCAGCIKHK